MSVEMDKVREALIAQSQSLIPGWPHSVRVGETHDPVGDSPEIKWLFDTYPNITTESYYLGYCAIADPEDPDYFEIVYDHDWNLDLDFVRTYHNDSIVFQFKDPQIAMMFKLIFGK